MIVMIVMIMIFKTHGSMPAFGWYPVTLHFLSSQYEEVEDNEGNTHTSDVPDASVYVISANPCCNPGQ